MQPALSQTQAAWYALQVRPRHEKHVAVLLRQKGYLEFLPLYRARRQWSDRIAELELPLFPGYLFCSVDFTDRLVPLVTTPGIVAVVGAGRHAIPVDDREIAAVRAIVASGLAAEPWPFVESGAPVRVCFGALAGHEGVLIKVKKRHRLVVSVTVLQRSVAVEIDSSWVAPLVPPACARRCRLAVVA